MTFAETYNIIEERYNPDTQLRRMLPKHKIGDTITTPNGDKAVILSLTVKFIPINQGGLTTIYELDNGYSFSTAGTGNYYLTVKD